MRRREFLAASAAGVAASPLFQSKLFAAGGAGGPRVCLIGAGWYGKTDTFHLLQVAPGAEVVGVADVDARMAGEAAELIAGRQESGRVPPTFGDYRAMLERVEADVAVVGTPDHWHALPMIDAVRAGLDVYVQKPISVDVAEGQAMVAAARKYGRTVQVGLQRRSTPHLLEAKKRFIDTGELGNVAYIDLHSYFGYPVLKPTDTPPPASLDWNFYVGPAPYIDYHPKMHPRRWRSFTNFGNGQTGDLCVHFLDTVRMMLGLGWPTTIAATGGRLQQSDENIADVHDTQTALFDYGETQVVWTQRNWGANPDPAYPWGATLYGDRGTLKISVKSYDFVPKGRGREAVRGTFLNESAEYPEDKAHKETEPFAASATRAHMRDFLEARESGERPVADIAEGYISTACCQLANLSMTLGRSLAWDAAAGRVVGDDEANAGLLRPYREPWTHPTPENV